MNRTGKSALTVLLVSTLIMIAFPQMTFAHQGHDHSLNEQNQSLKNLIEYLEHKQTLNAQFGTPLPTNEEYRIGRRLLRLAEESLKEDLQSQLSKPLALRAFKTATRFLKDYISPAELGRSGWNLFVRFGAAGAALLITETLEKAVIFGAPFFPDLLWVSPFAASETGCIAATAIFVGLPELKQRVILGRRFGSYLSYFKFLLQQGASLPYNWSKIVTTDNGVLNREIVVLKDSTLYRLTPRPLKKYLFPIEEVQRATLPWVTLSELKTFIQDGDVSPALLSLKAWGDERAFAAFLLDKIEGSPSALAHFKEFIESRAQEFETPPEHTLLLRKNQNVKRLLKLSVINLQNESEPISIIATRFYQYFENEKEHLAKKAGEQGVLFTAPLLPTLYRLTRALNRAGGIASFMDRPNKPEFQTTKDWEALHAKAGEAFKYLVQLRDAVGLRLVDKLEVVDFSVCSSKMTLEARE